MNLGLCKSVKHCENLLYEPLAFLDFTQEKTAGV
jgi:hypothetical protein